MIKNNSWDKISWLSSNDYFNKIIIFLQKHLNISENTKILDIGCGRGHFLEILLKQINFINKPIGLDVINYQNNKNFTFIKTDPIDYFYKNKNSFDLFFFKQSIHFFHKPRREKLFSFIKERINSNGYIIVMMMDESFDFPVFPILKKNILASFESNYEIFEELNKFFKITHQEYFEYSVQINKNEYIEMINNKFISSLEKLNEMQISEGIDYINKNYPKKINFKDSLFTIFLQ